MYTAFISFGIVMLLYLVVNDLLVEAREALSKVVAVVETPPPTPPRSNTADDSATTAYDLTLVEEGKEMSNSAPVTAISTSWYAPKLLLIRFIVVNTVALSYCIGGLPFRFLGEYILSLFSML